MNDIPAFPRSIYSLNGAIDSQSMSVGYGMSLRDYFAAKAMNGILETAIDWFPTGHEPDENSFQVFKDLARDSYHIADAMMKAREA